MDVDASLLLDILGDPETVLENKDKSNLLQLFLTSGTHTFSIDATDINRNFNPLQIDEWSNLQEIDSERKKSLESIKEKIIQTQNENDMDVDNDLGSKLEDHLLSHTSFTIALIERLCMFINEIEHFDNIPEVINTVSQVKVLHTEKLLLQDNIEKLSTEIITLQTSIHICNQEKLRIEKSFDRLQNEFELLKQSQPASTTTSTSIVSTEVPVVMQQQQQQQIKSDEINEYIKKIEILEKQLSESESAKSKVEMTLTERMARPLTQTEAQIADMRKSMEELRQQCKQRVASLINETTMLNDKLLNKETALEQLERIFSNKFNELIKATKEQIEIIQIEKHELSIKVTNFEAEISIQSQLKLQVSIID